MKISIVPENFIISAVNKNFGMVESNFLLHGLKIKNDTNEVLSLKGIYFDLMVSGASVKEIGYSGKNLEKIASTCREKLSWLTKEYGAKLFLGKEGFWNPECFTSSTIMEANKEMGIFNEYFIIINENVIDELRIRVSYLKNGEEHLEKLTVPLVQYKNKNQYIFPLKGNISTCGNYNSLMEHRQHYSMEFAFDMAQLTEEQKLCYKDGKNKEDFPIYGKEILAIADGEVVDCYYSFELTTSWNWNERKVHIDRYGFLPAQCGNYVVLKHANKEYSFYGHMDTNSLTVKKGDLVKQGQAIGKVGTTGLSNCPHLHFQLMDGPDFLSDRGLPCYFSNIRNVMGDKLDMIREDNLIIHAE